MSRQIARTLGAPFFAHFAIGGRSRPVRTLTARCYPIPMQIAFDIPEAFAAALLAADQDPARAALESLAVLA